MALTDEEKLQYSREAFIEKLWSIESWDDFKTLLTTVTKDKVKTFLKNNLAEKEAQNTNEAMDATQKATDLNGLQTEIDEL